MPLYNKKYGYGEQKSNKYVILVKRLHLFECEVYICNKEDIGKLNVRYFGCIGIENRIDDIIKHYLSLSDQQIDRLMESSKMTNGKKNAFTYSTAEFLLAQKEKKFDFSFPFRSDVYMEKNFSSKKLRA